jgi:hypothetical protein
MRGVHVPLNHIATAIVIVPIVVAVVVIIVVRVVAPVAESEAVPEVAVVESATIAIVESISIVESAAISESTRKAATMETTITETASHATVEATAFHAATTCKAATVKTSTSKATTMATAKTATAHAASVATAEAATAAAMTATTTAAATTSAATRQRHGRRNQADARNCQQRDNRFAQHHHSPSEIPLPSQAHCRWRSFCKIATHLSESRRSTLRDQCLIKFKVRKELCTDRSRCVQASPLLQMSLDLDSPTRSCCQKNRTRTKLRSGMRLSSSSDLSSPEQRFTLAHSS